jgi:hypothetical protein
LAGSQGRLSSLLLLVLAVVLPSVSAAGEKLPPLSREHRVASSTATFRTPEDWVVSVSGNNPEVVNVEGGELVVRFLRWDSELGADALHVMCLVERVGEAPTLDPTVRYEYEFLGGQKDDRRVLDSAYAVKYAAPVKGYAQWRHRVVTVVGKGEGICVVAFCPVPLWKRSTKARETLKAVVASVSLP